MDASKYRTPAGFLRIQEGRFLLVVREELAKAVCNVFAPFHQAWTRISQRRFSAHGRAGVVSLPLGQGRPDIIVRRYVHGGILAGIGKDLYRGPQRAINELAVAEVARLGRVRVPKPVGILGERAKGPFWKLAYLSVEIDNSEDLVHYCCRLSDYPPETAALEKRGVLREAALQIRRMHDAGILHGDLHLKNLLLQRREVGTPEVFIIDFDKAGLGSSLNLQQRLGNLKRLARSVRKLRVADAALTAWDRLRFLREYLRGRSDARRLLRLWAKKLAASGRTHEIWWVATGARRTLRGDRIRMMARMKSER